MYANRNKRSITLNLKSEEGKKALFQLVKTADVVVENFRPGVAAKLGIDYESMKAVKPDIIMASLSGYGQTGPYAKKGAYSNLAEAQSGLMYLTGWPNSPSHRLRCGFWRQRCRHVLSSGNHVRPVSPRTHRGRPVH